MNSVIEPIFQADAAQTDLPTALQLMSGLSRNRFIVQALDAREQVLGEIEVKGGMVLRAEVGDLRGREAVFALLNLRPQTLSAFHAQGGELGEALGSLERLLMEGAVVIDELARTADEAGSERLPTFPGLDAVETGETGAVPQPPAPGPRAAEPPATEDPARVTPAVPWGLVAALLVLLTLLWRRRS